MRTDEEYCDAKIMMFWLGVLVGWCSLFIVLLTFRWLMGL